jgi:hypothetical protein
MNVAYPEGYTDEDKAAYDDLISRGRQLIGSKIKPNDEFLLDLSAKITINQWRGYKNDMTDEEIQEIKRVHKETARQGLIETPPELFYDGLQRTEDGNVIRHPLDKTAEECNQDKLDYDEKMRLAEDLE